jgi:hypothetical protein
MRLSKQIRPAVAATPTRREFLCHCATFFAAAALAPVRVLGGSAPLRMKEISLDDLSFTTLAGQVNTTFQVQVSQNHSVDLELVQALLAPERGSAPPAGRRPAVDYEEFSLVFRGDRKTPLEQKMFNFSHEQIGRFELFIVPVVSRDTENAYYEAVFNRPKKAAAT